MVYNATFLKNYGILGDDKNYSIGIAIASIIFYKTMVIKNIVAKKGLNLS